MRVGRTLPPAAVPISFREILSGLSDLASGMKAVARFETELREYYGVTHVSLVNSGRTALTVILTALKELHPEREEVVIPAYTCYSVPAAVTRAGLKVLPCDVDPATLDFDWEKLGGALDSGRVLCAVSAHLFGFPADVDRLKELASPRGIFVVEDAAQAMGGEVGGRKIGTLGDIALFSLGRGKAFSTVSGGIILTGDTRLGDAVTRAARGLPHEGWGDFLLTFCYALALSLLVRPGLFWLPKALPFLRLGETRFDPRFSMKQLGAFQVGLARGWQERLARLRETRLRKAVFLEKAGVKATARFKGAVPNLIRFPVLVDEAKRRRLIEMSEEEGLGVALVYPDAVTGIAELRGTLLGGPAPQAEQVAKRLVSLPLHPFVTEKDLRRIADLLNSVAGEGGN